MKLKAYSKPTTLTMSVRQDTALLGWSKIQVNTGGDKQKGDAWEEAASKDNNTETDDLWDE